MLNRIKTVRCALVWRVCENGSHFQIMWGSHAHGVAIQSVRSTTCGHPWVDSSFVCCLFCAKSHSRLHVFLHFPLGALIRVRELSCFTSIVVLLSLPHKIQSILDRRHIKRPQCCGYVVAGVVVCVCVILHLQ